MVVRHSSPIALMAALRAAAARLGRNDRDSSRRDAFRVLEHLSFTREHPGHRCARVIAVMGAVALRGHDAIVTVFNASDVRRANSTASPKKRFRLGAIEIPFME